MGLIKMSSDQHRKIKAKDGKPMYKSLYNNLQEKHSALQKTFKDGLEAMGKLTREIQHQKGQIAEVEYHNSQLEIEARRSIDNYRAMKRYKKQRNIMIAIAVVQMVMIFIMGVR
jgi:predicted nuclease with TOPRIM domain